MFTKLKSGKDRKTLIELMAFIVTGTQSDAGSALVPAAMAKQIVKLEPTYIGYKNETPDPAGNVQVYATSLGIAAAGAPLPPAAPAAPAAPKPEFKLESGLPIPESKRGALKREEIYPFALMEPGVSFFVAATEVNTTPAKGLQSTVASANKRFMAVYPATTGKDKHAHPKAGQPTGKDGRKFTVRAVEGGARVWRVS
jgi:hypothetical protein